MIKKIGFSASRCIRDIVEDKVNIRDVVMITTGTDCPTIDIWIKVMDAYATLPIWDERSLAGLDMEKVRKVAEQLWQEGKVHQPRTYGGYRTRSPYPWMDLVHTKEDRDANPVLAQAWERAQVIEGLIAPAMSDYDAYEQDMADIINNVSSDIADATDDTPENENENQLSK